MRVLLVASALLFATGIPVYGSWGCQEAARTEEQPPQASGGRSDAGAGRDTEYSFAGTAPIVEMVIQGMGYHSVRVEGCAEAPAVELPQEVAPHTYVEVVDGRLVIAGENAGLLQRENPKVLKVRLSSRLRSLQMGAGTEAHLDSCAASTGAFRVNLGSDASLFLSGNVEQMSLYLGDGATFSPMIGRGDDDWLASAQALAVERLEVTAGPHARVWACGTDEIVGFVGEGADIFHDPEAEVRLFGADNYRMVPCGD